MSCEVILVNLKNHQSYIIDNIKNLLLFGNKNITVITSTDLIPYFDSLKDKIKIVDETELDIEYFDKGNKQNSSFRNGFWPLTSKRLFCVYEYIKKYKVEKCFHLENDTMVYKKLDDIIPSITKDKLYVTIDAPNRCIAGIMYIPNYVIMSPLIEKYMYNKNDMINLVSFFNKNPSLCESLPIIQENINYKKSDTYSKNYDSFKIIFDGAAIGQYLGGVDPRNKSGDTRGFINETTVVKYNKYKFLWIKNEEYLYIPHIELNNKFIPICNLHIHSKRLGNFMGDDPKETKLIPRV